MVSLHILFIITLLQIYFIEEILGKMNVWFINEFLSVDFIETVLKPEYLQKALFMIVLDLTKPGEIIEQLKKWCVYIYDKFSKLLLKLPVEKQQEMKTQLENYLKLWEEPNDNTESSNTLEKPSEEQINLKLEMPLKEGLNKVNLGIPFVYVFNKSDVVNSSNDKKRYEEDSEFIFKHIRKMALTCKLTLNNNKL